MALLMEQPTALTAAEDKSRGGLITDLTQSCSGDFSYLAVNDSEEENEEFPYPDRLASSCFSQLRLERDEDLTDLGWLTAPNLLATSLPAPQHTVPVPQHSVPERAVSPADSGCHSPPPSIAVAAMRQLRPIFPYPVLIFVAIEQHPDKEVQVKDLYNWLENNFPEAEWRTVGWRSSLRHTLSLNKSFVRTTRLQGQLKAGYWRVLPAAREGLLASLRRHLISQVSQEQFASLQPDFSDSRVSQISPSKDSTSSGVSEEEAAVSALLSLRWGDNSESQRACRRKRRPVRVPPRPGIVPTSRPSQDHAYAFQRVSTQEESGSEDDDSDVDVESGDCVTKLQLTQTASPSSRTPRAASPTTSPEPEPRKAQKKRMRKSTAAPVDTQPVVEETFTTSRSKRKSRRPQKLML